MRIRLATERPALPPGRDVALAAGLLLWGAVEALLLTDAGHPAMLLVVVANAVPLAWRRCRPSVATGIVASALAVQVPWPELRVFDETFSGFVCLLVATYSLGRHGRRWEDGAVLAGCALVVAMVLGWYDASLGSAALALPFVLAPAVVGRTVERRSRLTDLLERQEADLRAAAQVEAAAKTAEVRGQIAGDVQEVVTRRVREMVDEAGEARRLVEAGRPGAVAVVAGVEVAGRAALDEMRAMLGVLRGRPDPPGQGPVTTLRPEPLLRPVRASHLLHRGRAWVVPVVLVVAVVEAVQVARPTAVPLALACALAVTASVATLLRDRRPLAASVAGWAAMASVAALGELPVFTVTLVAPLLACALGARSAGRTAGAGLAVGVAGVVAVNLVAGGARWGDYLFPAVLVALAWQAGRLVRRQNALLEQARTRAAAIEQALPGRITAAATEERLRIARELHDVLAHTLMVMVVQAGAARRTLESGREGATEALTVVEETGRSALTELRKLLSLVDPHGSAHDHSPGLRGVSGLVEQARAAGLAVELTVEGTPVSLPGGLDLAAYRVVQEALTNVVRHAHARRTSVRVRYAADDVTVEVCDDGRGRSAGHRPGNGISGMQERVGLYGGELEVGPARDGGFRVRARLPLAPQPRLFELGQEQPA